MLRITRKANREVVFKVSGQLTAEKRGGDGDAHCGRNKRQTNCLGLCGFEVSRCRGRYVSGEVGSRLDQAEELRPLHPRVDQERAAGKKITQELEDIGSELVSFDLAGNVFANIGVKNEREFRDAN